MNRYRKWEKANKVDTVIRRLLGSSFDIRIAVDEFLDFSFDFHMGSFGSRDYGYIVDIDVNGVDNLEKWIQEDMLVRSDRGYIFRVGRIFEYHNASRLSVELMK